MRAAALGAGQGRGGEHSGHGVQRGRLEGGEVQRPGGPEPRDGGELVGQPGQAVGVPDDAGVAGGRGGDRRPGGGVDRGTGARLDRRAAAGQLGRQERGTPPRGHEPLGDRVRRQPVGAVHPGAGHLADGEQALDRGAPVEVGQHAAARVVRRGGDRHRLARQVEAGGAAGADDPGEPAGDEVGAEGRRVQPDVLLAGRAQVGGDGGRDDVARREVGQRVSAGHDPPSRPVDEHRALPAHRFGHQHLLTRGARAGPEHGRVELHHLHVGDLGAGPQRQRQPVAGRARGGGGRGVDVPVPAGGQHDGAGEQVSGVDQGSVVDTGDPQAGDAAVRRAQRVQRRGVLEHLDAAGAQRPGQRAGDLRAAGVAAGVHDAVTAVPALAGQGRAAVGAGVEARAERPELRRWRPAPRRRGSARRPRRTGRRRRPACR